MRILQWILMVLGWWSAGLLLSAKIVHCRRTILLAPADTNRTAIVDPCPKLNYKVWTGSIVALGAGILWYFALGLKGGIMIGPYLTSVAMSAVLGATVARILCPKY
jgi:hypothetical protein